ncbi:MAG: hypothetical protein M1827_003423 [Pycnora praestabilis]|nr:MAG: hypothetical protein M1827_003423 [Pycnora praestabilis]
MATSPDLRNAISLHPHPFHSFPHRNTSTPIPESGTTNKRAISTAFEQVTPSSEENDPVSRYPTTQGSDEEAPPSRYTAETDPYELSTKIKSPSEINRIRANTPRKRDGCGPITATKEARKAKNIQGFYESQNENIERLLKPVDDHRREAKEEQGDNQLKFKIAVHGSFAANVLLAALQLYGATASGSLSLFTTMADALFDPLSNVSLILSNRAVNRVDPRRFPSGKARIETAGNIMFCFLMSSVSFILIALSALEISQGFSKRKNCAAANMTCDMSEANCAAVRKVCGSVNDTRPFHVPSIVVVSIALCTKFGLFLYCWSLRHVYSQVHILWEDHRNDIMINGFGLLTSVGGSKLKWWIDPAGAIALSILIATLWLRTCYSEFQLLIGVTADTQMQQLITYISMTHSPMISAIDTVRAYHSGPRMIVEVDIVMDPNETLRVTHDVAEELQTKFESLPDVERAYVHIDFETSHKPVGQLHWEDFCPYQPTHLSLLPISAIKTNISYNRVQLLITTRSGPYHSLVQQEEYQSPLLPLMQEDTSDTPPGELFPLFLDSPVASIIRFYYSQNHTKGEEEDEEEGKEGKGKGKGEQVPIFLDIASLSLPTTVITSPVDAFSDIHPSETTKDKDVQASSEAFSEDTDQPISQVPNNHSDPIDFSLSHPIYLESDSPFYPFRVEMVFIAPTGMDTADLQRVCEQDYTTWHRPLHRHYYNHKYSSSSTDDDILETKEMKEMREWVEGLMLPEGCQSSTPLQDPFAAYVDDEIAGVKLLLSSLRKHRYQQQQHDCNSIPSIHHSAYIEHLHQLLWHQFWTRCSCDDYSGADGDCSVEDASDEEMRDWIRTLWKRKYEDALAAGREGERHRDSGEYSDRAIPTIDITHYKHDDEDHNKHGQGTEKTKGKATLDRSPPPYAQAQDPREKEAAQADHDMRQLILQRCHQEALASLASDFAHALDVPTASLNELNTLYKVHLTILLYPSLFGPSPEEDKEREREEERDILDIATNPPHHAHVVALADRIGDSIDRLDSITRLLEFMATLTRRVRTRYRRLEAKDVHCNRSLREATRRERVERDGGAEAARYLVGILEDARTVRDIVGAVEEMLGRMEVGDGDAGRGSRGED